MRRSIQKYYLNEGAIERTILNKARKENQTVYGARAIQKQAGIFARGTSDYDIFTSNPKKSAQTIQKDFDMIVGGNEFYAKKGMNKTTWKVKHVGMDGIKDTRDDIGVVDYTAYESKRPKTVMINGVAYRDIRLEKKAKVKVLKDKLFAFRHKKDREDLNRIKLLGY